MGFFSWQTADWNQPINNKHSPDPSIGIYMLQPNGVPPIFAVDYDGYGVFNGVNVMEWLGRMNRPDLTRGKDDDFAFHVGHAVLFGCNKDKDTGELFSFHGYPGATTHGRFDEIVAGYDKSASDLCDCGQWVRHHPEIEYPLKFSFNSQAVYEDLPASKDDPDQGFFFEGGLS
jgi:hypothetical protein